MNKSTDDPILAAEIAELAKTVTLAEVKEVANYWLYLPDDNLIDFLVAICCSVQYSNDPLWAYIIGSPSSGKTEMLRNLYSARTIMVDSLTPHTLVSGLRMKGMDNSLFKNINNKILIIKDLTNLLSARQEDQDQIWAQLRNSYDGFYNASFGNEAAEICYKTHYALLCGVTQAIDMRWSIRQKLGERFLAWRLNGINKTVFKEKIDSNKNRKDEMRRTLKLYFGAIIRRFENSVEPLVEDAVWNDKLWALSDFVVTARSGVHRDQFSKSIDEHPEAEQPPRLKEQLLLLGSVLRSIRMKKEFSCEEYKLLYKVAIDTIPPKRLSVLKLLFDNEGIFFTTALVAERISLPTDSCRIVLEDLQALKIVDRIGSRVHEWQISEAFRPVIELAQNS